MSNPVTIPHPVRTALTRVLDYAWKQEEHTYREAQACGWNYPRQELIEAMAVLRDWMNPTLPREEEPL